jgi:cytochrome c-type biogenesis protein CcsB
MTGTILFMLALAAYFAAAIIGIADLFRKDRDSYRVLLAITIAGFSVHTAAIIYRYVAAGYLPISSMHEAASFFAWSIVLVQLFLSLRYHIGIMGAFIMPVVFSMMFTAAFLPRTIKPLSPVLQSNWLWVHTIFAFLGYAAFAVAFGVGIMYLIQEHYLKSRHLGGLFQRLPSLQALDDMNYRLISLGFPLLTLAIVTGALWSESAFGYYWRWDSKEVWSLITWLIYATIFHLRLTAGWRKKRAAWLSIIGFLVVLFTFFGVSYLLKSYHQFS